MSHVQTIFSRIRGPFCKLSQYSLPLSSSASIIQKENLKNALGEAKDALAQALSDPNQILSANLCDYLFFPIAPILKSWSRVPSTGLEYALECIRLIYNHGWKHIHNETLTLQLILLIMNIADGWKSPSEHAQQDPYVQETALEVLTDLIVDFRPRMEDQRHYLLFAKCFSYSLDSFSKSNSSVRLQKATLGCMDALLRLPVSLDILTTFLPGIVSGLAKGLSPKGPCRYFQCVSQALQVLDYTLVTIIGDKVTKDLPEVKESLDSSSFMGVTKRTAAWKRASCQQISTAVKTILHHRSSQNLHIQTSLFRFCFSLFTNCLESLKDCRIHLLETMLLLVNKKENPQLANNGIELLSNFISSQNNTLVMENVLSDCLQSWSSAWSGISNLASEDVKLEKLKQLRCLLTFAGQVPSVLQSTEPLFEDILSQLSPNASGIEANHQKVLTTTSLGKNIINGFFFGDHEMEQVVRSILLQFADSPQAKYILQSLFLKSTSLVNSSSLTSFWAGLHILKHTNSTSVKVLFLESYEQRSLEILQEISQLNTFHGKNMKEEKQRKQFGILCARACIAMDCISWVAAEQGENFRPKLMNVLYPILEHLAFASSFVSTFAEACIESIVYNCKYGSAAEMLRENIDYVVNSVALKLNTLDITPQLPLVMAYVIRNDDGSGVQYIGDVIESIFTILDNYHGYTRLTEGLLGILYEIIKQQSTQSREKRQQLTYQPSKEITDKEEKGSQGSISKDIQEFLEACQRNPKYPFPPRKEGMELGEAAESGQEGFKKHLEEENEKQEKEGDENEELMERSKGDEEEQKESTGMIKMVQQIAEKAQLFLTHEQITIRVQMIRLLGYASQVLVEDPNTFYPTIHTCWPLLITQLNTGEAVLVELALGSIAQMCTLAYEFMGSRIRKDLIPRLRMLVRENVLWEKAPPFSKEHRLQRSIACVGLACMESRQGPSVYLDLLDLIAPILRCLEKMPQTYSDDGEFVESVWNAFSRQNPDAVYYEREVVRHRKELLEAGTLKLRQGELKRRPLMYRGSERATLEPNDKASPATFLEELRTQPTAMTRDESQREEEAEEKTTEKDHLPSLNHLLQGQFAEDPRDKKPKKPLISML
ncbi:tel Two Interacting protein 1 [Schizosaccharomyces cryophilus OY26]|uniref:Tel Two Interacting protein 1 n=1 Tax=Schizosaccharomyces cryophilus (strain OY26 / ATCC MYA-4695 / CBS 11777 / NBRC 106824 / NRRL Y48691) TaxID=653667 RepID=S9XEA5_SCHCR|nr:tel Two Interacting protein 1 [Schizosaccharomyces cryophilus OY26]EPY52111.1 tel Two Interacting protein 1 [Schizosaccharomyces cryophilus OY26]